MFNAMDAGFNIGRGSGGGGSSMSSSDGPLGLPAPFVGHTWRDIELAAAGGKVRFWMWSGADHINAWVDGWLAPRLLEEYSIGVVRVPMGAPAAVAKIKEELLAGNSDSGSVDLIWINGANFKNALNSKGLFGPWANKVCC